MKKLILTSLTVFGLAACASNPPAKSESPASAPAPAAEAKAEPAAEKHEKHEWPMAEMEGVHDVLGPAWHGAVEKNNDKAEACAAVPGLKEAAAKLLAGKVPADKGVDQAAFTDKATAFQTAIGTFEGTCGGDGPADLMAAFSPIHDAFHAVMDLFKKAKAAETH